MVPVLDKLKQPLMPCSEKRARKLLGRKEAKPYWKQGIFCIILQKDPSGGKKQEIGIGIDPGSKFNGYSVKSKSHTLFNLQLIAKNIKGKVKERKDNREGRRKRKTPYRKHRFNRAGKKFIAPSTKTRWNQHLNILILLSKLYPITHVVIEDVAAKSIKGARKWNENFSPLEYGKTYFKEQIEILNLGFYKFKGYDTAKMRASYKFKKNKIKSDKDWYTHAVDAWCIVNEIIGGHTDIDNTRTLYWKPLEYHRRKLHELCPAKKGYRRNYGGTLSLGLKRGSLVKHARKGLTIVGGTRLGRISLHRILKNKRVSQEARLEDIEILSNFKYFTI